MAENKKHGLGRGLEALFGEDVISWEELENTSGEKKENAVFKPSDTVAVEKIVPNPHQPRTEFNADAMKELVASIRHKGVLQPLLVRPRGDKYEIVAGERRWRAAQQAGLQEVPVVIRKMTEQEALEIALIENLQRENLSAIEEAEGISRLMAEYAYTQEKLAEIIGKSRSHISNIMRLLTLPEEVKQAVRENKISFGHARAMVGYPAAAALTQEIIAKGLSVREVEKIIEAGRTPKTKSKTVCLPDEDLQQIMRDLQQQLKLKVKISASQKGKGSVTLHYNNPAELSRILDILEQR